MRSCVPNTGCLPLAVYFHLSPKFYPGGFAFAGDRAQISNDSCSNNTHNHQTLSLVCVQDKTVKIVHRGWKGPTRVGALAVAQVNGTQFTRAVSTRGDYVSLFVIVSAAMR